MMVKAQDKPKPEPPKPVFQVPMDKDIPVTITFKLKAYELSDFLNVEQKGTNAISQATDLTAAQASSILAVHSAVQDSINRVLLRHWLSYYKAQEKMFKDTLGKHAKAP